MPARDVNGAREVRLLELVLLAHVDDDRAVAAVLHQIVDVARIDLPDPLLHLPDQVCSRSHCFRKYSGRAATRAARPKPKPCCRRLTRGA